MSCSAEKQESVIATWARERLGERTGDSGYLVEILSIVGAMGYRDLWREVAGLLEHPREDVVVAALDLLADWEEVRAYPEILRFWDRDPRQKRPRCARALRAAVRSLTGERIDTPGAFRAWLMS